MGEGDGAFRLLFEESPDVLLVLLPDAPRFTMFAATRARLVATQTTREATLGRGLFEVFPDNPDDPDATGTSNLRASLERVIATRAPDTMAVQKYDIRGPDGSFQTKYWSPKNLPVLSPSGELLYILHRVEDVTDLVRADELGEELRDRTRAMEREVVARSRELDEANRGLREANARLGELDAAKTAFFSNVSHEFRTPLTLILGPIEDALANRSRILDGDALEAVHRSALRLLRLVNSLLDFSRMEAGRQGSSFEPTDLATLTGGLAGSFQSLLESAGLRLSVDCPPLSEPVYVDRSQWEKIVLNLVSNAFKFTFEGEIAVALRGYPDRVELVVRDTGAGIPESEHARIFERFHRVEGARGRSFEGTGIGLALVQGLVHLHRGSIEVQSTVGRGTTFRVSIPMGHSHLPREQVSHGAGLETPGASAYLLEASRWIARGGLEAGGVGGTDAVASSAAPRDGTADPEGRVLLADDNADMREYIVRLLQSRWQVEAVGDGAAALESARERPPDLILSDVMMPRMNGLELLQALRRDPRTSTIPLMLLSARAGEEAVLEGLETGADDYLVKPFSARELITRVRTHLEMARVRRAAADAARELAETRAVLLEDVERKNRELEAFSYSVSHDLRAPLRSIDGFSQALLEDYGPNLEPQAQDYLRRVRAAAQRMGELIDDLLELSRVERGDLRRAPLDLSKIADEVGELLKRSAPQRSVQLSIRSGVVADADARLIWILLENLLGNAWKFTTKVAPATIELGSVDGGDATTFFVRDNGAGFDPARASRLFAPFQRLHAEADFPGTGIGLATVQRIVHRHGGRVWAESAVGRGATFFWTLPTPKRSPP